MSAYLYKSLFLGLIALFGVLTAPFFTLFVMFALLIRYGIRAANRPKGAPSLAPMFLVTSTFMLVSLLMCIVNALT